MKLEEMPNIGFELAKRLESAGISDSEELISAGSGNAFLALNAKDPTTCINTLFALEGAVRGIRWHHLTASEKLKLKEFFNIVRHSYSVPLK